VSPAYHLHPEFGLLCPSPTLRRKARRGLAYLAALIIVGALALMASHDSDIDGRVTSTRGDVETTGQATAITTTVERSHPLEGSKAACKADPSDGNCRVATARKLRSPRAANEAAMIAALPLGRSTPPALPAESEASLDRTDVADTEAADPPGRITPAPKKVRRPSRSRNDGHDLVRDWNWRDDRWSARAYALPDHSYQRGRYERSWGGFW
jgi:hypothetical protein